MTKSKEPEAEARVEEAARTLELSAGYSLSVVPAGLEPRANPGQLVLSAGDGRVCLRITLGPDGPEVSVEAASLALRAEGAMRLSGRAVSIESEEGLRLRAGGALELEAADSMSLSAKEQRLVATHGDVHVEANDDVRVDGERVRLNAPDAAPLRRKPDPG